MSKRVTSETNGQTKWIPLFEQAVVRTEDRVRALLVRPDDDDAGVHQRYHEQQEDDADKHDASAATLEDHCW